MSAYEHNARLFMEEYKTTIKNLRNDLQEAQEDYIELQQIHDDTMQEMNAMEDIIAYQDAQLPQMYDKIVEQCCFTNQQQITIDRQQDRMAELQAELSELKRHLSDVYDKNRRLCLDLEAAEHESANRYHQLAAARAQADNAIEDAITCRRANDSLLDINQTLSAKLVAIEQALNPCPTPQPGETVPPRPMWSRYRSE
jgi:chromosome segregation ATPase